MYGYEFKNRTLNGEPGFTKKKKKFFIVGFFSSIFSLFMALSFGHYRITLRAKNSETISGKIDWRAQ